MADAKGGSGAATIPALAKNPRLADAGYPVGMILQGRGAMPALSDLLSPAQIAGVVTYIRTHFGNNYRKPVTEADVKLMASKFRTRPVRHKQSTLMKALTTRGHLAAKGRIALALDAARRSGTLPPCERALPPMK